METQSTGYRNCSCKINYVVIMCASQQILTIIEHPGIYDTI